MSKFDNFKQDNQKVLSKSNKRKNLSDNMDIFVFRNIKKISMGIVELFNNTFFHGFDTLKVRLQAKCKLHDLSGFYKNKVESKSNQELN